MKSKALKADLTLLMVAAIWGFAFVAQIKGMDHMGPFFFNAARFALGGLSLIPVLFYMAKRQKHQKKPKKTYNDELLKIWGPGLGIILFLAASFQQVGLQYTTAGNSGFITGLYIVIVPIAGIALGQSTRLSTWVGALVALAGLYFLTVGDDLTLNKGDLLTLGSALMYAIQILVLARISAEVNALKLSIAQFFTCAAISFVAAFSLEVVEFSAISKSLVPLLYTGLLSTGVAFTIQIVGQRNAIASHVAIILSLEAVFAVLGGWLILNEQLGLRGLAGCSLMLAGMVISQLKRPGRKTTGTVVSTSA